MKCPKCGGKSGIIETRPVKHGIRRRHKCFLCCYRFSTLEITMDEYKYLKNMEKNYNQFLTTMKKTVEFFNNNSTEKGGEDEWLY